MSDIRKRDNADNYRTSTFEIPDGTTLGEFIAWLEIQQPRLVACEVARAFHDFHRLNNANGTKLSDTEKYPHFWACIDAGESMGGFTKDTAIFNNQEDRAKKEREWSKP